MTITDSTPTMADEVTPADAVTPTADSALVAESALAPTPEYAPAPASTSPRVTGLFDALTTTDHKRVGRLWLRSGLVMLLVATIVGVVVRIEYATSSPDSVFGGINSFFQYFNLYRIGLALLVAAPLFVGLATVVVPMQVGATNIAFPRAAHSAAWLFMIGASITVISVFAVGGWGALDGVSATERDAIALTLVGTALVIVSLLVASVCIATTVVSLRTAGMTLLRVPLFAWSMLVATSVWLLTLPVALANLAVVYFDLRGGPGTFAIAEGSNAIYTQIGWLLEQPQVYAFAIPVLGMLGQLAPVIAQRRHAQHIVAVALIGVFGLLSVGAWNQPWFQGTRYDNKFVYSYDETFVFIVFGLFAALPVVGLIASGAKTILGRPPTERMSAIPRLLSAQALAALGASVLLLAGTVAGLVRVIEPLHLGGRTTVTAVMNLVLFASVLAAIAGIWFWAPKISGKELPTTPGRLVALKIVGGAVLLGGADFVSGFFEAPAFAYSVATGSAVLVAESPYQGLIQAMNVIAVVGVVLLALGAIGVFTAIAIAARSTGIEPLDDNPFGGQTLEWATSSPPLAGNFSEPVERVVSEAPLLDAVTDNVSEMGREA